jgi:hypothetical protein
MMHQCCKDPSPHLTVDWDLTWPIEDWTDPAMHEAAITQPLRPEAFTSIIRAILTPTIRVRFEPGQHRIQPTLFAGEMLRYVQTADLMFNVDGRTEVAISFLGYNRVIVRPAYVEVL